MGAAHEQSAAGVRGEADRPRCRGTFQSNKGVSERDEQCDGGGVAGQLQEGAPRPRANALGLLSNRGAVDRCDLTNDEGRLLLRWRSRTPDRGELFTIPLSLGAMISFFSLTLSYVNAGARIMLPMGEHGFFPKQLRVVDVRDLTHAPQSASASA